MLVEDHLRGHDHDRTCGAGLPSHPCGYIDVWESEAACARAFTERIHPAVDAAFDGVRPGEPSTTRLEVVHASGALTALVDPR